MDSQDSSEPVRVYVRIRPEFDHSANNNDKAVKNNQSISNTNNNCCAVLDAQTVKLIAPDGVYAARKSVSAVDDKVYTFDKIFNESCSQEDVYGDVAEHVLATVRGYNTTIFAYGTTGSGKSYTMTGNKTAPGIIPRAIGDLFRHIENAAAEENDVFFYVRLSYVELYNNNFRNLLEHAIKEKSSGSSSSKSKSSNSSVNMSMNGFFSELDDSIDPGNLGFDPSKSSFAGVRNTANFSTNMHPGLAHRTDKIEVRESQSAGVFLAGPNLRIPVTSALEAFQLIAKGNKLRATGATACNDVSSRSHAILTFHVESRITSSSVTASNHNSTRSSIENETDILQNSIPSSTGMSLSASVQAQKSELRLGKMHLVDLAGSERLSLSGAEGDTRLETQQINLSLTALGDVLSALSRNATCLAQQQKSLSKSNDQNINSLDSSFLKNHIPAQVPVPYRNSKLTHLLKDSLGGNSKTVMITTIRTTDVYYQQTAISLMYASRAKKVRNRSLVNRNVIGDTGIHAVSSEIERLKKSLEDRSNEFERLRVAQLMDAQENSALKLRLQEMKNANDMEKRMLENQVSQVIHSQAGHIAAQREKISVLQSALQDELTLSQNRIAEQEKEIKWLKKALDETSLAAQGPHDQLQRMQKMVEAWQSQAKSTHHELSTVLKQAEELKVMNSQLTSKLNESEATKRQLHEEITERTQESTDMSNEISRLLLEQEQLIEANKSTDRAYQEAKAVLKEKMEKMLEKEYVLKENTKLISTLEKELAISRELATSTQNNATQTAAKLSSRVKELEIDKNELTSRLNNAIGTLEKSTARVVDDANAKLQVKDSKLKQADEDINLLKNDRNMQKKQIEELKRLVDTNAAQYDKIISELKDQLKDEKSLNSKNAAKIISLDELIEGFRDKILKMKTNEKEYEEKSTKQIEILQKELREKDRALKMNLEQRDAERVTLMTEFERILEEKKQKYQSDINEAHATAAVSSDKMQTTQLLHVEEMDRLKLEFAKREETFQMKLKDTEIQMKALIDNEIDKNIKQLEAKHSLNIQKVKDQYEEELRDAVHTAVANAKAIAHEQHLQVLNEKLAIHQLDKESIHLEFSKLLKDSQEDFKLQKEELNSMHEQNINKLNKTHLMDMQQLEEKISAKCEAYYEEQLKLADDKHRIQRNKDLEKERSKLIAQYEEKIEGLNLEASKVKDNYQQSLKNIEYQRELLLQESVDTERSRLLLVNKEKLDEQRASLTSTFHEQMQEQAEELTARFTKQIEKERQLVMGEQEKYLQELSMEQQKKIDSLVSQMKNAEDHHIREIDLLENKYKKEAMDAKKEFEVLQRMQISEHERTLLQLKEEMSQYKIEQQEYVQKCLADQQKELLDRNRNESIKLRLEMQDMEVRHQDDLSAALQEHVSEMTKQRKMLETAHTKYIETLQEELASTKEHYNEILTQTSIKESKDSNSLIEQKSRFEEILRKTIEDKDRKHQLEIENIETINTIELNKAKSIIAKLKAKSLEDISGRELELEREHQQTLKDLQDKHAHMISDLKSNYENKLKTEIQDTQSKSKSETLRIVEEAKERELSYQLDVAEAEKKIRELTQTLQKQKYEFQEEQSKLLEDKKNIQLLVQTTQVESSNKIESLQIELENRLQTKHKSQIKIMQEEYENNLNKIQEDSHNILVKKENQYQREIALLKKISEDQEASNISAMEDLQIRYKQLVNSSTTELNKVVLELETIKTSSTNEINRLQSELAASKSNYEDELQRALKLYSNSADLVIHHKQELQHLQDQLAAQKEQHVQQHDKQMKEHLLAVEELSKQNAKDLQKLTDDMILQKNNFEIQIENNNIEYERRKDKLIDDYEKEINAVKTTLAANQTNFDIEISRVNTDHKQELQHLQDQLATQKEQHIQQYDKQMKEHLMAVEELSKQYERQKDKLIDDYEKEINIAKTTLATNQTNFDIEISRVNDALVEKQIEFVNHLQEHDKQLIEMKKVHVHAIEILTSEHEKEIEKLQLKFENEIVNLQENNKKQIDILNNELKQYQQHSKDLESLLMKERELSLQREEELKEDLNTLKAQGQADVFAERASKANEIDELKFNLAIAHNNEVKDLYSRIELLEADKKSSIQQLREELIRQSEDHQLELAQLKKNHNAILSEYSDQKGNEFISIQRQLSDKDEEKRDLQRQLVKNEAIREVLKQDTENMRIERQQLRDKVHALEMEIIEHGKAKFESRLMIEKDRVEQSYKQVIDELKHEVIIKIDENKNLTSKLEDTYNQIADIQASIQSSEEERDRVESMFRSMLADKDASYDLDLKRALDAQQQELQGGYLKLIQQQVESLMEVIQKQATQTAAPVDDLQEKFLALVQDLPDFWQKKHGNGVFQNLPLHPPINPAQSIDIQIDVRKAAEDSSVMNQSTNAGVGGSSSYPRTPLRLLGQAARGDSDSNKDDDNIDNIRRSRFGGRQNLPWSSPSLRSSPTDQLIAAILDGDVQGIRAVVRSKGEDLKSEFWKELARSVLPLHRAVSGLHFHGSEKLLVATIEALTQLGADVNASDHAGNSVLHKAIQVCTSKSVSAVVNTLLQRGANPSLKNKDGDFPLHSECKRIRSASVEVIEALVAAGADPNVKNNSSSSSSITPLTLVLLRGATSTSIGVRLIGNSEELGLNLKPADSNHNHKNSRPGIGHNIDESYVDTAVEVDRNRSIAGKRVWIKAAEMLLKAGASFDRHWKTQKGCTQLHLLLASFPPSREDSSGYRKVLKVALDTGLDVFAVEEEFGQNSLFILCEQMAITSSDVCPDSPRLIHLLLRGSCSAITSNHTISTNARRLVNSADRSGRLLLDIPDRVEHSCLSASKSILRDASQGIVANDYISSTYPSSSSSTSNTVGGNHMDWEVERTRVSSALISNISKGTTSSYHPNPNAHSSASVNSNRNHYYQVKGEAELKFKTSQLNKSHPTSINCPDDTQDYTHTNAIHPNHDFHSTYLPTNSSRLPISQHGHNSTIEGGHKTNTASASDTKQQITAAPAISSRTPNYFYPNSTSSSKR